MNKYTSNNKDLKWIFVGIIYNQTWLHLKSVAENINMSQFKIATSSYILLFLVTMFLKIH